MLGLGGCWGWDESTGRWVLTEAEWMGQSRDLQMNGALVVAGGRGANAECIAGPIADPAAAAGHGVAFLGAGAPARRIGWRCLSYCCQPAARRCGGLRQHLLMSRCITASATLAGLLHDTVEDCGSRVKLAEIEFNFGPSVRWVVAAGLSRCHTIRQTG